MEKITSANGKYVAIQQDDDNFVIYELLSDGTVGLPLWDQFSYEANLSDDERILLHKNDPEV